MAEPVLALRPNGRPPWVRVVLVALATLSCGDASRPRDCEPVRQTGCNAGQTCVVGTTGAPACVAVPNPGRVEGESCETMGECAQSLGCVRVGGVARCLRFCLPSAVAGAQPCKETQGTAATHPYTAQARCLAAVVDRPDIGICVLPCAPDTVGDCPPGLACTPSLAAGMAICGVPGEAQAGDPCGTDAPCDAGLACMVEGQDLVCRPFKGVAGCPAGEVQQPVPGIVDGTSGAEILVCAPG